MDELTFEEWRKKPCLTQSNINRLHNRGFKSYGDYLASDAWQAKRREYFASGLPTACLGCDSRRIDLHHRTYTRIGGTEQVRDLLPLCRDCHYAVHEYERTHRRFAPFKIEGSKSMKWVDRALLEQPSPTQLVRSRA